MKYLIYIVLIVSLIHAKTLSYDVSTTYVLGDNDTKIEARSIALEQAKKIALEEAGTYVEVKTIVNNGKLTTDEIKSYGATVLKVKILKEKYFFKESPILKLTVNANIDMDILQKNIDKLKNNKNKRNKIFALQKENEQLLKKIEKLSKEFKKSKNNIENIRIEREQLLSKMKTNHGKMIKTFKKGSLFDLSNQYADKTNKALQDIDIKYFQFIKNNTMIDINNIKVSNNGDGTSDVSVDINWSINNYKSLLSFINNYFKTYPEEKEIAFRRVKVKDPRYFTIHNVSSLDTQIKNIDKKKFFNKLVSKQVLLQLKLGKYTSYIPIATGVGVHNSFGTFKIILSIKTSEIFYKSLPLIFKNIPNSLLKEINSIETDIIITSPIYQVFDEYYTPNKNYYNLLINKNNRRIYINKGLYLMSEIASKNISRKNIDIEIKKIKNHMMKIFNLQCDVYYKIKLSNLNKTNMNNKNSRINIQKKIKKIKKQFIKKLTEAITIVKSRSKQENKIYAQNHKTLYNASGFSSLDMFVYYSSGEYEYGILNKF